MGYKLEGLSKTALAEAEEPPPPQQAAALLTDQVVFNIYRRAVQDMQRPGVLGLLQMQRRVCGSSWRCRS